MEGEAWQDLRARLGVREDTRDLRAVVWRKKPRRRWLQEKSSMWVKLGFVCALRICSV